MPDNETFDLRDTYLHLRDGGAAAKIDVTEAFWPELAAGQRHYDGRLVMVSQMTGSSNHWERHPAGEEVLYLLSGAVDVVLEEPGGECRIPLRKSSPGFLVPAGVWHRFVLSEASEILFATAGEGTEHKPV